MFYAGATPWHGLGVKLPANATWETVRAAVGFYDVEEVPVYAHGNPAPVTGFKALRPVGEKARILSIVGADYGVVQFADMAKAVVEAAGGVGAVFHTGGLLGSDGARGWLMGEIPSLAFKVPGDVSEVRAYFMAYSGHDGQTPVTLANVDTRIVCRNTLGMTMGERGNWRATVRHTSQAPLRVEDAAQSFATLLEGKRKFRDMAEKLARTPFTSEQMGAAIDAVVPAADEGARNEDRIKADRAKLFELSEAGTGMEGIRGTAWGAFQSFAEWADHFRLLRAREALSQLENKAFGLTWGPAAEVKQEALSAIRQIARV